MREVESTARRLGHQCVDANPVGVYKRIAAKHEVATFEIRRAEDIVPTFEALKGRADALYGARRTTTNDASVESYVAFLSEADQFNSSGERLRTAAAIIRQDRAHFHRFGRRDQGDERDSFFADAANREALEQISS